MLASADRVLSRNMSKMSCSMFSSQLANVCRRISAVARIMRAIEILRSSPVENMRSSAPVTAAAASSIGLRNVTLLVFVEAEAVEGSTISRRAIVDATDCFMSCARAHPRARARATFFVFFADANRSFCAHNEGVRARSLAFLFVLRASTSDVCVKLCSCGSKNRHHENRRFQSVL